jgi:ferrous iron transport protein A
MFTTLSDMKPGDKGRICGFYAGNHAYRQKLLAMGLTSNIVFTVIRCAPLGDPIQIQIRESQVCLRKTEAEILKIERV